MIRFEVTGATPEEFAEQLFRTLGVQINLYQAQVSPPATQPSSTASSPPLQAQTNGSENSSTALKEMAPPAHLPPTLVADRADDLFVEQKTADPAPEVAGTKASSTEKKTKGPKLDDLKTRLSEVIVAATERWDQKRANAYARKLLELWGVMKLSDLPAANYDSFLKQSEYFIDGTAAE